MKKTLIILMVLTLLGMLGGLYNTLATLDTAEEVKDYAAMDQFPYEMPQVVMHPAPGYILF